MSVKRGARATLLLAAAACAGGCVEVTQVAAPDRGLLGGAVAAVAAPADEPEEERPFVGVTLEESLGSLDEMDFAAGLDVVKVDKGSPAAKAGLRVGDRVVTAAGVELLSLDAWQAVLDAQDPAAPLPLEVERDAGVSEVTLALGTARAGELPPPTRFAERLKVRAVFETVVVDGASGARVSRILRGSPLPAAGVAVGARVIAVDGRPVDDASGAVRAFDGRDFGEDVVVTVMEGGAPRDVGVELWSPPRRLTRLQVPIVFDYEHDPARSETTLQLVDLWLFSLYEYRREGESRRHRLLYLFEISTGVGELEEVAVPESAAPESASLVSTAAGSTAPGSTAPGSTAPGSIEEDGT